MPRGRADLALSRRRGSGYHRVVPLPDEPTDSPAANEGSALTGDPAPTAVAHQPPADGDEVAVPDEQELERVAVPATVRRAPKYGAFITAGALVGALLGFVLVLVTSSPDTASGDGFISFLGGDGTVRILTAGALAVLGGLVGGALAVGADRRSTPRG
ncbi:hypothetical protein BH11ACT1_BH11ACT1_17500 [soil metagenome]